MERIPIKRQHRIVYLTTGNSFWTITPVGYYNTFGSDEWDVVVFDVTSSGLLNDNSSYFDYGLRPVINIRNDVTVSGDGTMGSPYVFS